MHDRYSALEDSQVSWQAHGETWTESAYCGPKRLSPAFYATRSWIFGWRWRISSSHGYWVNAGDALAVLLIFVTCVSSAAFAPVDTGGTGTSVVIATAMAYSLACHNSIWTIFIGIPFERTVAYHKFAAVLAIFLGIWHGVSAYVGHNNKPGVNLLYLTGWICEGSMLTLGAFSFSWIRRKHFEVFYKVHVPVAILAGLTGMMHASCISVLGPAVGLWLLDVSIRMHYIQTVQHQVQFARANQLADGKVVRLSLPKCLEYSGGQYCFVCVPELSLFQWHPFSISSAPHEPQVTFHVRALGDWTQKLCSLAAQEKELKVLIEGPYGAPMINIHTDKEYQHFLLISGGIGITPLQSICNSLLQQHKLGRKLKSIVFVWSVREQSMLEAFPASVGNNAFEKNFVPNLIQPASSSSVMFDTQYYLTNIHGVPNEHKGLLKQNPGLQFGRPNLPGLFNAAADRAFAGERIAVLVCGPQGLVSEVRRLCIVHGTNAVFDFHAETFAF